MLALSPKKPWYEKAWPTRTVALPPLLIVGPTDPAMVCESAANWETTGAPAVPPEIAVTLMPGVIDEGTTNVKLN